MRYLVRGRRLRRSPLRRRSDVVEARTLWAVIVLLLVMAPLVGGLTAWWADGSARATAREQRADRRHIRAEVIGRTSEALPVAHGGRQPSARTTVRWTEPDGDPRTATARVPAGTRNGDMVDVWLDSRGRSVAPPPDSMAIRLHTVTLGVCATAGAVAVILLGHAVVRRTAMRRRLAEWEQEWAATEPEWTGRRA
ncbi:membrane protein [Streptomyces viridochromogenes]|uniref:Membrane protein n=1 Tax=Streptomyces viridochromogenes TaxID=1938 RepID=A0A0J7Z172_STRVR|nr:hypothetical protein [Streptomyces viridochromogenes]KMS69372.1 membrane protein [Streptomyces viridochromogenes]KOG11099.1 membrane protein [Streptomyces viridochromogenes]KOG12291.1 membrane protein [Streptomyces viridochromogenes]